MRTLELFAGTQSFSKAVKRLNDDNEVVTVDISKRFKPTHAVDLLDWNYKEYPTGHFDVVWASPPCTEYSKAKTVGKRDLEAADALVRKALEIIEYFAPRVWFLENVGTGLLVHRMPAILELPPPYFVDYCAYGKPYRKRTALWTNAADLEVKLCEGPGKCPGMVEGRHRGSCGNTSTRYNEAQTTGVWAKCAIPETLLDDLLAQITS